MTDRKLRTFAEMVATEKAARKADLSPMGQDFEFPVKRKSGKSISVRTGRMRDRGSRWGCIACALLTVLFNISPFARRTKDHCDDAMGK